MTRDKKPMLRDTAERSYAVEETTRETRLFAQGILDGLSAQIAILDESGIIVAANKAWREFARTNGATGNVAEDANYLEVCDSATGAWSKKASTFAKGVRSVLGGQREEFMLEYPCHSPTQWRWFIGRVTRYPAAGPPYVIVTHENITERKQAEEAQGSLAAIVQSSDDAIIGKALDGTITSWNKGAEKLYGYSAEEAVGRSISMLVPSEYHYEEITKILEKISSGERVEQLETARLTKDKRIVIVSLMVSPVYDSEGNIVGGSAIARDITERKLAEERLREAEVKYRSIFENSTEGIFQTSLEGRVLTANSALAHMLGYDSPEELIHSVTDIARQLYVNPMRREEFADELQRHGIVESFEVQVHCKDGDVLWVSLSARVTRSNDREIEGFEGVVTDISRRKQAEEEVKIRTRQQKVVARLSQKALEITDLTVLMDETVGEVCQTLGVKYCKVLELLPGGEALLGWAGMGWQEGLVGGGGAVGAGRDSQAGYTLLSDEPVIVQDLSTERRFSSPPLLHDHGVVSGMSVVIKGREGPYGVLEAHTSSKRTFTQNDIHFVEVIASVLATAIERRRAEEKLQQLNQSLEERVRERTTQLQRSEERIRAIVDTAPDGIITMTKDGLIRSFNRGAERIFGYKPEEVVGKPLRILMPKRFRSQHKVGFKRYLETGETRVVGEGPAEFVGLRKSGEEFPLELSLGEMHQVGDILFTGIVRDITHRKRIEENLKTYAGRLQQSNRELQNFAYIASHDLQEPLRKVRTFGSRLRSKYTEALGEQGGEYLERMEGATIRMQSLINDLLTLAQVTTRAQPLVSVDLNEVAQEVISDLEPRIEQVGGRVEVDELPVVEADQLQMHQLLQNLIGNALKFYRKGEPPIVKVRSELSKKRQVESNEDLVDRRVCRILVEDNGIGFDEEDLERIFAPFHRLHGRSAYEGSGMGLAICRKVVERHSGSITAKSAPGRGTTFVITIPVKQSESNL